MDDVNLEKYCLRAVENGATRAKQIDPGTVVTAPWVRLKCQFGCPAYGRGYACPPHTPESDKTRKIIDCYHRAILFHLEIPKTPDRGKLIASYFSMLTDLEGEMFKDGYYKAFIFLSGPCRLCEKCAALSGELCYSRNRCRPSMEACGIDVYQTVRNNGFALIPLKERTEPQNHFALMLVD